MIWHDGTRETPLVERVLLWASLLGAWAYVLWHLVRAWLGGRLG